VLPASTAISSTSNNKYVYDTKGVGSCSNCTTVSSGKSDYFQSTHERLYARCKTFKQNQYSFERNGDDGSYYVAQCSNPSNCAEVTYKPSNKKYGVQGAVSSSARIAALSAQSKKR
jgi:hypothetical protein